MSVHVMHDIETFATSKNALITALGACKFDPHGGEILDSFYIDIDPISAEAYGQKISAQTIMWWFDPARDDARKQFHPGVERIDLFSALDGYAEWFGPDSLPTWGNAATFDNERLRDGYALINRKTPWEFWDDRCYRTLKNLAPGVKLERVGVHHNALGDALSQAKHAQAIVRHLGLQL